MKISFVGWIALITCMFYACNSDKRPPGVLSKAELVEFLVNMHVGEARIASVSVVADSAKKLFRPYEAGLLEKQGITDSTLKMTYHYYLDHPTELEAVYDIVIDTLSLREQKEGLKKK
jgi:hypothetical protein